MSDTPDDRFNTPPPPPEGFDVPEHPQPEELAPVPDSMAEPPPITEESLPPMSDAVPMMADALPAMAGGLTAAQPESRVAIDSRSFLPGRIADEFVAWLKTLASAAVYATLIVTFGFQVARVEGQSMAPTLADQDRLIVNKAAYKLGDPQIGDIVMLYYPNKPEKSFVKRVIAQEGDQVRIVAGKVYRNEVLMDDSFVPPEYRSHDDWGPEVIPEGYYFVMGDHRNNSSDSRHWGYVPKKYIIGKVQLRWWPVPAAKVF